MKDQEIEERRQRHEEKRALLEQRREEKRLEKERLEEERRMEKEQKPVSPEKEEELERNLLMNSLSKKNRQAAMHELHQSVGQKNVQQRSVAQRSKYQGSLGAQVFM